MRVFRRYVHVLPDLLLGSEDAFIIISEIIPNSLIQKLCSMGSLREELSD